MQHSSTSAGSLPRRAALARVYGIRLLYRERARRRIAFGAAGMAVVAYILLAGAQLAGLPRADLKWDWVQFRTAAVELAQGRDPYASFLRLCPGNHWCQGGYIFPPLLAELMRPFAAVPSVTGATAWLLLSHLMLVATIVVLWRALRDLVTPTAQAVLLVVGLAFLPLYQSLYFLQVGVLLLLLLSLAAAAQVRETRRGDVLSGVWVGVAAVLRVSPVLLAPALVRLRAAPGPPRLRWYGLLAMGATGLGLLGVLALLTPYTRTYFTSVLPRIGGGTPFLDNQSIPAVVERVYFFLMPNVEPPAALVGLTAAVAALVPTWLLWQRALRSTPNPRATAALGFAAVLAALPLVSNITWQHHLILEVLVYALLAPSLAVAARPGTGARGRGAAVWLAVVSYPLMWTDRHITDPLVVGLGLSEPRGWRVAPFLVLTSVNVLGMACLWLACLVAMRQSAGEAVDRHAVAVVHGDQLGDA